MNSDPYDSAAWRAFGMLDADECAIFDETMRGDPALRKLSHEMDRLAAAIAASNVSPIRPSEDQLEKLQNGLKLNPARRTSIWIAASGWAAAAALAIVWLVSLSRNTDRSASAALPEAPAAAVEPATASTLPRGTKIATKRLTQEITVLRENLERFQNRDRTLFTAVPGVALPVVMTMNPPGVPADDSPLPSMLGDAARWIAVANDSSEPDSGAMAVYDAARDSGTLIVNYLPLPESGQFYNLWVTTSSADHPIYVGSLPESGEDGTVSFDFSLGSTMILPSGFTLTLDPPGAPAAPSETSIVLQGPPPPSL